MVFTRLDSPSCWRRLYFPEGWCLNKVSAPVLLCPTIQKNKLQRAASGSGLKLQAGTPDSSCLQTASSCSLGGLWRARTARRAVELCAQRVAATQCSLSKTVNLDPWDCFVLQPMAPVAPGRQWALVISLIMVWIWANLTSFSTWVEGMDSSLFEYRGRLTLLLSSYSVSTLQKPDVVRTKSQSVGFIYIYLCWM